MWFVGHNRILLGLRMIGALQNIKEPRSRQTGGLACGGPALATRLFASITKLLSPHRISLIARLLPCFAHFQIHCSFSREFSHNETESTRLF